MPVNNGWLQLGNDRIMARIRYSGDPEGTSYDPPNQAIIDDPVLGAAMVVTNTTTTTAVVTLTGPAGNFLGSDGTRDVQIPPGGLTASAADLRRVAGIRTRADVLGFSLSGG